MFGWFKKGKTAARVEPPVQVIHPPGKIDFAREAVLRLGYLKPTAETTIAGMMEDQLVNNPKAIVTAFRKAGEQISDDEKRALGIKTNGFMSRIALGELTDKGKTRPLEAHEITLRRASMAMSRSRLVMGAREAGYDGFKYSSVGDGICTACDALDGKLTNGADAHILPPPACTCETGRYNITIDWFADLD